MYLLIYKKKKHMQYGEYQKYTIHTKYSVI